MVVDANWYSCNVSVINRSKARTAVGAAAYITGTCLYDRELEASPNYEPSDYRRKGGVEQWFITAPDTAPEWAFDIEQLTNEAQARDTRKNSCIARVSRFSLPHWADEVGREQITHEVAEYLAERYGVAVIAGIHAPDRHGDERNWHAHLWFTTRAVDEDGLGAKTRILDDKKTGPEEIVHIREAVAVIINRYMEEEGVDERVDHRSYEDRAIKRIPTIHLGSAASALERKGIRTERGDRNREIRAGNEKLDRLARELAEVQAEITRELEKEFIGVEPELEPEPEIAFLPLDISNPEPLALPVAAAAADEQKPRDPNGAFTSDVARAYMEAGAQTPEEAQAQSERRWYEEVYHRTVETMQHYWSRFVDRIQRRRDQDRDREDFELER